MEISRRSKNFSIFKIMQNLIRQDLYIFFDCLQSTIIEEIDALTLFEYCQNNNITAKYIAKKDGSLYKNMNGTVPRDIIFIEDLKNKYLTKELFFILIRAKALITSFGDINDSLEKMLMGSKKTEYISIGHRSMFFKTAMCKTEYLSPRRYNKRLISNEYERELLMSFGWQENQLISAGLPRWDKLSESASGSNSKKGKNVFIFLLGGVP